MLWEGAFAGRKDGRAMLMSANKIGRRFQLILIKSSHYDDDGYVIQWFQSAMPANSLACVHALAIDAASRHVLGANVAIDVTPIDETNTRVKVEKIVARMRRHDGFGLVALIGIQSNQIPRALDVARPLREAGIQVAIGGFHVSGCLALLPEMQADLQAALDMGCSLFAGEAEEGRLDQLLCDAAAGTLQPIYNYLKDLPSLESVPVPFLPPNVVRGTINRHASFDAGRGCPFQCSFCTIINVQGRKSRYRSPDDVEALIRQNWEKGLFRFFITDDNFARNREWEAIFDRIIELRERDRIELQLIIQVDTSCHRIAGFVDKAQRAGVTRVFIGLENINPDNLLSAKKRQNKITEYRRMLLAWKNAGVVSYCGYIIGFPADSPESVLNDIRIIQRELPLDILEFFCLTPLPGSEDHKVLWQKGAAMDPDMNKYDLEHIVASHPQMSVQQWHETYKKAWEVYYSPDHLMTLIRRGLASGMDMACLKAELLFFSASVPVEGMHPLQAGIFRRKYRRDRRPGLPIEPVWTFYPRFIWETLVKHARVIGYALKLERMVIRARREQRSGRYVDLALTPVSEDETEGLELFTQNEAAREQVTHIRKVAALTGMAEANTGRGF
jgi:hypothetical protein